MKLTDPDNEKKQNIQDEDDRRGGMADFWKRPETTKLLLGIIAVLLVCILILVSVTLAGRGRKSSDAEDLQQAVMDYAQKQQELGEQVLEDGDLADADTPAADEENEREEQETEKGEESGEKDEDAEAGKLSPAKEDRTAVVVDIEDENDEAYTKEFILKEAYPFFEDNNQEAIWDLAHLKRYVKLSRELEDTGEYYYQGGVDSEGKPDGTGLAIYGKNSYYFGTWSHGKRSGQGTWYRYYINERKNKTNADGVYMAHSYAGSWADDLPNGEGAEHYDVDVSRLQPTKGRILQNVVGNFADGLYDGDMYANTVDYIGNVQEWDGIAKKGVFTLWRDMSSIGECAVWRYKDDPDECLDIDVSENKNQGIRELLK